LRGRWPAIAGSCVTGASSEVPGFLVTIGMPEAADPGPVSRVGQVRPARAGCCWVRGRMRLHDLIDRQRVVVMALLGAREDETVAIARDEETVARTR